MSGSGHDLNAFANTSWIKVNLQTQESWLLQLFPHGQGKEGTPDFSAEWDLTYDDSADRLILHVNGRLQIFVPVFGPWGNLDGIDQESQDVFRLFPAVGGHHDSHDDSWTQKVGGFFTKLDTAVIGGVKKGFAAGRGKKADTHEKPAGKH